MSPERAPKVAAIIAAAGFGQRFTERGNKPLVELMGKPLFLWALEAFERHPAVHKIVPVFKENDIATAEALLVNQSLKKVQRVVPGGKERQDSVYNGLQAVSSDMDLVLVHDGARPLITEDIITRVIEGISGFDGAIAAVPPKDTIKEAGDEGIVSQTLERSRLWAVQTPQGFYRQKLLEAYERAKEENLHATDDASFVEHAGGRINIVMGSYENLKVTTPEDLDVAELLLKRRQGS